MAGRRGVGVDGHLGPEAIAELAVLAEACGYGSFWINVNTREENAVRAFDLSASRTKSMEIAIGVFPLDRYTPDEIAQDVKAAGLSDPRFIFGVGAGRTPSGRLGVDRRGVAALREASPKSRVAIGGYGPQVLGLAGEIADAVNLNWMTPNGLAGVTETIRAGAERARKPLPQLYLYHRAAQGPDAAQILVEEVVKYRTSPAQMRHQAAMGNPAWVGVAAETRADIEAQLTPYQGAATMVMKPKPPNRGDLPEWRRLIEFFAPNT